MKRLSTVFALALIAAACGSDGPDVDVGDDDDKPIDEPGQEPYALVLDLLPEEVVDVDLLFVIDNSGSMAEEQASLALWARDALFGTLELDPDTQLNLHIGVVSTNMGAGPFAISGCEGSGDGGALRSEPRLAGCEAPLDHYLVDVDNGDGTRTTNYSGTLDEAFGCIAQLGIDGCGFEHPLEAMKRALDGSNPANAGFLREDALLAVVIVSDEDDCSAFDTQMFDTASSSIDDPLGPLSSFRCFEFGIVCDGDDPRTPGAKTGCASREDSAYMTAIADYADFLKDLKDDPGMVVVAGIFGEADGTAVVETDLNGNPQLAGSCTSDGGYAFPGIRLQAFLDQFPDRNRFASICSEDMSGPLAEAAARIKDTATCAPCLRGEIAVPAAAGGEETCKVWDKNFLTGDYSRIPSCADAGGAAPCYTLTADATTCGHTETSLAVDVTRDGEPAPGTHVLVECLTL